MRVDLRAECKKLEDELGMKKEEIGVVSAYKQFVMRAYKVPEKMDGKSIAEIESEFSPERLFVERVKNAQGVFDAEPDLRLHAGNLIVLSGRPRECSEERAIRCNPTRSKSRNCWMYLP